MGIGSKRLHGRDLDASGRQPAGDFERAGDEDIAAAAGAIALFYALGNMDRRNKFYFGDNLKILGEYVPEASVDPIYLDPPFNSGATYNVLFKEKSGDRPLVPSLVRRGNRGGWRLWGLESEVVYKEIVASGPRKLADLVQPLLPFLGRNQMVACLVMIGIRLIELRRVLKPTGSIYLHCNRLAV